MEVEHTINPKDKQGFVGGLSPYPALSVVLSHWDIPIPEANHLHYYWYRCTWMVLAMDLWSAFLRRLYNKRNEILLGSLILGFLIPIVVGGLGDPFVQAEVFH
ncbi:MAG: hypothetical protein MUO54_12545 [Anaerolineales bacterium]|nr:hypothetical protein [Anaerolineales bacterium]